MLNREEKVLKVLLNKMILCDDCLSNITKIQPRQSVNTLCNELSQRNILSRGSGLCEHCHKTKLVNQLINNGIVEEDYLEVWVNLDLPLKNIVFHLDRACTHVINKKETPYKGLNIMKRDGGWLQFENKNEAEYFYQDQYSKFKLIQHC